MVVRYRSGEEIKKGDRVLFHTEPGEIEFVATDASTPETVWYVQKFGDGVMVWEPKVFGLVFIRADSISEYEDLQFVSRAASC